MKRFFCILLLLALIPLHFSAAEEIPDYTSLNIQCNDDYVYSVVNRGGVLYALLDSGLYRISSTGDKDLVCPVSDLPSKSAKILADTDFIYVVTMDEQACIYRIDDNSKKSSCQFVLSLTPSPETDMSRSVMRNGYIYYRDGNPSARDGTIVRVSLDGSNSHSVHVKNLVCFDVLPDETILVLIRESNWPSKTILLKAISPDNGTSVEWGQINNDSYWSSLIYDSSAETVYLVGQDTVYSLKKGKQPEQIDIYSTGDIAEACVFPGGLALARGRVLNIHSFNSNAQAQRTILTICGPNAHNEWFTSFLKSYPTISIRSINSSSASSEERFIRDMLTQNSDIDIFIMSNLNLLSVIKQKEYYYDLATSDIIKEKTSRMYSPFIQAFTDGNHIAAMPHPWGIFFSTINYNGELFSELDLPVPSTWEEFFDFCILWKTAYEPAYPDITVNPFTHPISLVSLLALYDDEMTRSGIVPDYRSTMLLSVLQKYLRTCALYPNEETYDINPLFYDYDLHSGSKNFSPLSLTFLKESEPIYTPLDEDICYFVVNPFSTNLSESVSCVALARDEGRANEPAIYSEIPDLPLEIQYYDETMEMYLEELSILEVQLAHIADDPARHAQISDQIVWKNREIEDLKSNRYWLTEENMTAYREIQNHVYFNDFNPIRDLYENEPRFFMQVTEASLPGFLDSLSSKIQAIRLERGE